MHTNGFYAYPSAHLQVTQSIESACSQLRGVSATRSITTWQEIDAPGRFIRDGVLTKIDESDFFVADITQLNFNVTYEIGYAIGRSKPVLLTRNAAFAKNDDLLREIGLFDTITWKPYENSSELVSFLRASKLPESILDQSGIDSQQPIFLVQPRYKTDGFRHVLSRLGKARLNLRSFDPNEQPRLAAPYAIREVARSLGVVVHFSSNDENGAEVHNHRSAFVAGLADGLDKASIFLQQGDSPIPLDYRDFVRTYVVPSAMDEYVGDFAAAVAAALQAGQGVVADRSLSSLRMLDLGASSAENETSKLPMYFVETDTFSRSMTGDARLIVGRKGTGKTATLLELKERLRKGRETIVLDLRPDGYKLIKLREQVLDLMNSGTSEHTITAFWEYVLLAELAISLLEADAQLHTRDSRLFAPYKALEEELAKFPALSGGDFSERVAQLIDRIADQFQLLARNGGGVSLSDPEVTKLIHAVDLRSLKAALGGLLKFKQAAWLLFDNIDKGWPARGLTSADVRIIRTLIEATRKIERELRRFDIEVHSLIFLRNDVYELLVDETPDRGKEKRVLLDWYDSELLKELLRRRLAAGGVKNSEDFDSAWRQIAVSHVNGEDSAQYLVDRSLMRPRYLIDLVNYCKGFAVNLAHDRIEEGDIRRGVSAFSADLFEDVSLEIRDVNPKAADVLYSLIGVVDVLSEDDFRLKLMECGFSYEDCDWLLDLLLWYGIVGLVEAEHEPRYIYDYKYNWKLMEAHIRRARVDNGLRLVTNPAFTDALST